MRLGHDRTIFLALCVLDDAAERCRRAPVAPTLALRLALACLHAASDGDRGMHDRFWRVVCGRDRPTADHRRGQQRWNAARGLMAHIAARAGLKPTAALFVRIGRARRVPPRTGPAGVGRAAAANAAEDDERQRERWCAI
ncbi:hypothetical protein [Sphingomonas sanxanigenens]|uniref:Uncharacterized protein n=1 Tax=Sphingomonas sanxanigenens DSM 19645 = NX02 TaxID=1123269 RepID=W0A6F1_9SPHN|nr:hypothetical protein [Sphingomonas sanxanigenens]AHE52042.1 hypothetical protein NX02_01380 [Sphingomonas sanxanigenens DSM 19645 = NX02]